MTEENKKITVIRNIQDIKTPDNLKSFMAVNYLNQIKNFFSDEKQAMKFMSSMMAEVQKDEDLMKCDIKTVINSFMMVAQLGFMPSSVSGEAYVLPYNKKGGGLIAQFQLGYQGIVTLLYGAGAKDVVSELVRKNDKFTLIRGKIYHEIDPFKTREERGDWIGVYAIITLSTGGTVEQFMRREDIEAHAKKFSKSYFGYDYSAKKKLDTVSDHTPWNPKNDPEGWMPRKTVLKQASKLAPKNEKLNIALAEDNKDSIIGDRLNGAMEESKGLQMGNFLIKNNDKDKDKTNKDKVEDAGGDGPQTTE